MLVRILLLVAIVIAGYVLFRRLMGGGGQKPGRPAPPQTSEPQAPDPAPVTRCAHCGVHAPESGGVRYQNLFFCSPDHLQAYLKKGGAG